MNHSTPEKIIKDLRKDGISITSINELLSPSDMAKDVDRLIDSAKVNRPRYTNDSVQSLNRSDLGLYHKQMAGNDNRIPKHIFEKGQNFYRNDVVHVTVTNPLVDVPKVNSVIFSDLVQKVADGYLEGDSAIGYIKIKKSYANKKKFRSTNHKFHIDDNAPKILKVIFYLNDVEYGGGGFQFVRGSHQADDIQNGEKITFEDDEVISRFGSNAIQECTGPAGTCIFADTLGLHREGTATIQDRYATLINYVLEPEYGGTGAKQIVDKKTIDHLDQGKKRMARLFDITDLKALEENND